MNNLLLNITKHFQNIEVFTSVQESSISRLTFFHNQNKYFFLEFHFIENSTVEAEISTKLVQK